MSTNYTYLYVLGLEVQKLPLVYCSSVLMFTAQIVTNKKLLLSVKGNFSQTIQSVDLKSNSALLYIKGHNY